MRNDEIRPNVFTPQDFQSMFEHFWTLYQKELDHLLRSFTIFLYKLHGQFFYFISGYESSSDFYNNFAWNFAEQKYFRFDIWLSSTSIFLNATWPCFYFWTGKWRTSMFQLLFSLRGNMHLPDYFERSLLNIEFCANWNEETINKKHFYALKSKDKYSKTDAACLIDGLR